MLKRASARMKAKNAVTDCFGVGNRSGIGELAFFWVINELRCLMLSLL